MHDKCLTLETKAAMPVPLPEIPEAPDLAPLLQRVNRMESQATLLQDLLLKLDAKVAHEAVPSGPSAAELELLMRNTMEPLKAAVAVAPTAR